MKMSHILTAMAVMASPHMMGRSVEPLQFCACETDAGKTRRGRCKRCHNIVLERETCQKN